MMIETLLYKEDKRKDTVYNKLKDDFARAIDDGAIAPGELLPSENLLARKYNISRSSVRTALRELEEEGLIFKKPGKGTFVKDTSQDDSADEYQEIKTIGVDVGVSENGEDWYGSKIVRGMEEVCAKNHCRLALIGNHSMLHLKKGFVDGFICAGFKENDLPFITQLAEQGVYPVLFNRITDIENVAYFAVNYRRESQRGIEFLLDKGHKKIGVVTAALNTFVNKPRYMGYCDAMAERMLPAGSHMCMVENDRSDEFYMQEIYKFLKDSDVTAIYLLNGCFGIPFFGAAAKLGIRIPEDIEVLCFDDIGYIQPICQKPFSYVKMPLERMGRDAAEYLIEKISSGKNMKVAKKLYDAEIVTSE
jgi:GntR family transcriptional regulator of arabinose operon